jgi:hypothetical protein
VQVPERWYGHVDCVQKTPAGGATSRIAIADSTIDGLAYHCGYRDAAFARDGKDPLVALVVEEDLQAMLKRHAHTVA